ncbi:MAG: Sua5/YciO/YrdC/YwlC family protein [Saprospiraceae bacterium]|nr:Sua5/YciO/YrdC/YwlC family protein [Saprospiraceae bacterium]
MIWPEDKDGLCQLLAEDNLLLLPTDTVWGLCADATSPVAIQRILSVKGGGTGQGLVVIVSDLDMLKVYVPDLYPRLETLLLLHRRPLTVLYRQVIHLPTSLQGPGKEWAIRLTMDPVLRSLIQGYGKPIIGTAACRYGDPVPLHFGEIRSDILENVDYIAKWRRNEKVPGSPSSIVRLDDRYELDFIRS